MNPEPLAGFNVVAESRKWKEAVAKETGGMSMEERIAYFRRHSSVAAIRHAGAGGSAHDEFRLNTFPPRGGSNGGTAPSPVAPPKTPAP